MYAMVWEGVVRVEGVGRGAGVVTVEGVVRVESGVRGEGAITCLRDRDQSRILIWAWGVGGEGVGKEGEEGSGEGKEGEGGFEGPLVAPSHLLHSTAAASTAVA